MVHNSTDVNINNSLLTAHYMPRPRIDAILDRATLGKLVCVVAGAGYGKTQTVRNYISSQAGAVVRWVQLTESDNIPSRFWEQLMHTVSADNPELADKMREIGFPETLARFKQYAAMLKNTEHLAHKTFLVLDDFHLINSKHIINFAERCAGLKLPDICVVIVSRKEPAVNSMPLFARGKVSIITEDELRFTQDEIATFMELRGVLFSRKNLPSFYSATDGWALAVQFLSLVLKRAPGNVDLALKTMKQNIFKLFETEAFDGIPENVQKSMIKLTLVSGLPLTVLHEISDIASFLQDNNQLTSFIWFDSLSGEYRVHPLYLEFLQSKQSSLSYQEKLDVYSHAADWCFENNFYMDAMNYFAKSYQFERMVEILFSYPFRLPYDMCEYYLNVLKSIEPNNASPSIALLKNYFIPLMLAGTRKYEEARDLTFSVISEWESVNTSLAAAILRASYSNLAYIDMHICTATHEYNAPKYIKKSVEYSKLYPATPAKVVGPFYVPHIRSYACLVGVGAKYSEFDEFIEASMQSGQYISETFHNMFHGYDDLVACETAFFRNQLDTAKRYAHSSIVKAREKNQHSIEAMAKQYQLRIAIHDGDYRLAKEIIKQLRNFLDNPNFWNRQLLYDVFTGMFYSLIGLPNMSPSWLTAMNEKEASSEVHMPIAELTVCLSNLIAQKKYDQALTVLYNSHPRKPQERFAFSELYFALAAAVAKIKVDDTAGALEDFKWAYALSYDGAFEMFFIEKGKNLHFLVTAALSHGDGGIPAEWLKKIDRKASAYAKKAVVIMDAFKDEKDTKLAIQLSEREQEVLKDLYHGLSREEIAETRYLSVNTVKKILQSIYIKLNAHNNVDAIRIAIEKKLI